MKVAVLLSGGVDSSVALNLVKQQGAHEITAFYLKIWLEEELAFLGDCPWEEDLKFARAVCEQAGVPLEVVPLQTEYQERIVSHVLDELRQGRT
ncbi:MAG: tRNA 2-thiouridine(34) synthase MnmA, partial [Verrucomicrobia bacterium]